MNASNYNEQWHANGVQRWTTAAGRDVLAFTHRSYNEAVILSDPWTVKDGGKILPVSTS